MSIYNQDLSLPYCTYITFYRGNKLPPFYIGHSSMTKVLEKNYHGSVTSKRYHKIWLEELESNPELFKTKVLTTHYTKDEANKKESFFLKFYNAKSHPLYTNMNNADGVLTNKGMVQSPENRKKKSIRAKNRTKIQCPHCPVIADPGNFKQFHGDNCKSNPGSSEYRKALSEKRSKAPRNWKQVTCPHCEKIGTGPNMGRYHFSNCRSRIL